MKPTEHEHSPDPEPAESCCPSGDCGETLDRRRFFQLAGLTSAAGLASAPLTAAKPPAPPSKLTAAGQEALDDPDWPVLVHYDEDHIARIALPLGGIGTGTVSLCGNGSLRDWELTNRPGKGFTPSTDDAEPFFAIHFSDPQNPVTRVLEGPIAGDAYEASHGSRAPNVNLPRFQHAEFAGGYPFGRVMLSDPEVPADVHLKAYNPLIPADPDASGIPIAVLTFEIRNRTGRTLEGSICGTMPNFIGMNGWQDVRDWKGDRHPTGVKDNRNTFRTAGPIRGIAMTSNGVDTQSEAWGSLALASVSPGDVTYRTAWEEGRWGGPMLDFWDDFSTDGRLEPREQGESDSPVASLAVPFRVDANSSAEVTFLLAWHFPNRYGWNIAPEEQSPKNRVGNYYCTQYKDAWDVVARTAPRLPDLKRRTTAFVKAFLDSPLPKPAKEAALFNASTLRTQTCFRIEDGRFFGWEGCSDQKGCCHGSCTHVWNYEQTTAFLFGTLAKSMREVEFGYAINDDGVMSFRVGLPLSQAQSFQRVAADGQMGCILKMYRDWQLSGDDELLGRLWPNVRKAVEFCWIPGGWDGDKDGVMEGVQHNTMDVEYYGPNPEMEFWYLGALRAAEEMARHAGDTEFARTCHDLFERGRDWTDANLFNGEYYEQEIRTVDDPSKIASYFLAGMGSKDFSSPDYQLGSGCLADQLVGQYMAHVCGLGHLAKPENLKATLAAIRKYNHRDTLQGHFNPLRSFALESEPGLLIADYPKDRPDKPFPYYAEVWTGIEYTAAGGMLYEDLEEEAIATYKDARSRYDGRKRSPYDEAECGHHYARAMAAWTAVLAYSGFHYSAVNKRMTMAAKPGTHYWSNGYAWGTCAVDAASGHASVKLTVTEGNLALDRFRVAGIGDKTFAAGHSVAAGKTIAFEVTRS